MDNVIICSTFPKQWLLCCILLAKYSFILRGKWNIHNSVDTIYIQKLSGFHFNITFYIPVILFIFKYLQKHIKTTNKLKETKE